MKTFGGAGLLAPFDLAGLKGAGIVIVPSWRGAAVPVPEVMSAAIAGAHRDGAIVTGLCLGTFVLAAAGLLNRPRTNIVASSPYPGETMRCGPSESHPPDTSGCLRPQS